VTRVSASDRARTDTTSYTRTAIILHWLIAAILVGQFAWGWLMQEVGKSPTGVRADAFNLHKSVGLCLLGLMLFRLGWRLAHPPPPVQGLPAWQLWLARLTHGGLYTALIVMPLAGYLGSVASGYPVKFFGMTLPAWGAKNAALKDAMSDLHLVTSWIVLALTALHVAGALHHAMRGDDVMSRMRLARGVPRPATTRATRMPAGG
jgi:cytochrome b561